MLGIFGIVMFWAGIWDGIGNLPYLANPLISLGVGLIILVSSVLIFEESKIFGGKMDPNLVLMHKVKAHPEKKDFMIKYYDKIKNKTISFKAIMIKRIEKDAFLVLDKDNQETFIPIHRIKEVLYKGRPWKPQK